MCVALAQDQSGRQATSAGDSHFPCNGLSSHCAGQEDAEISSSQRRISVCAVFIIYIQLRQRKGKHHESVFWLVGGDCMSK